jgi:hypothetical protein
VSSSFSSSLQHDLCGDTFPLKMDAIFLLERLPSSNLFLIDSLLKDQPLEVIEYNPGIGVVVA